MNGYVEAVISSFILIFISVMLSLLERKTKFGKWKNAVRQILIGVVFGVSAILTSKISEVSGAGFIFNISESFSVCAALAFGWPAGIVCASVSGCESLMKFLYVSGNVTYLSDFITIMFAGLTAAVLQRLFGKNRRPSLFFVVVFCVVIESTHLLMIFLTNMQNIGEAYEIVKNNIAVLIISNVLVVSISLILCALVRKEPYKFINKKSERSISSVIEKSIIISILIAYSFTGVLTFFMMDNIIRLQTRDTLFASILSLESEMGNVVENKIYYNIMDLLYTGNNESAGVLTEIQNIAPDGVASADVSEINSLLQKYSVKSGFKEINAISKNRIIMYSNVESNVGSKVDDELIFQETDDIGKYVEMMIGDEGDEMCACVKTDINSESSEYIEYFQVVYDDEYLTNLEEEYIRSSSETLMIGSTGFFIVVKAEPDENGMYEVIKTQNTLSEFLVPDSVPFFTPEQQADYELSEAEFNNKQYCYIYSKYSGLYIIAVTGKADVLFNRGLSVTIMLLMELEIFALVCLTLYLGIRTHIIKNLDKVNGTLEQICGGNLDVTVDVRSNKEFALLSEDINSTVDTLKQYIAAEASRIDAELALARNIQAAALPGVFPPFPNRTEFEIFASMVPAKEVGGDFYDFFFTDDDKLAFVIADVSGKGIPGAMFMMTAKTTLKSLTLQGNSIEDVFETANKRLYETNSSKMFVTVWMGILDTTNGTLRYVNAGHNPPVIYHDGKYEYLKGRTGFVLAGAKNKKYSSKEIKLEPWDKLLLYTDGVTEATDKNEDFYGEGRLLEFLESTGNILDTKQICEAIKNNVGSFSDGCVQSDDITVLAIRYNGKDHPVVTEQVFTADENNTKKAIDYIDSSMKGAGVPKIITDKFNLSTDEIFSNIIKYAYKDETGDVRIRIEIYPDKAIVSFADKGISFDPLKYENPEIEALPASKRSIGGLGIFVVKKLMDKTEYHRINDENILTLTKSF